MIPEVVKSPPGPKNSIFRDLQVMTKDPLNDLRELKDRYGDVLEFRLIRQRAFLVSSPDDIEEVLVHKNRSFIKSRALRDTALLLGKGLLTSEGDFWRRQRRLAQPAFHRSRIETYGQIMVDYTHQAIQDWHDGETCDIHAQMMALTLWIVARALFNADVKSESKRVGHAMSVIFENFSSRARTGFLIPESFPTPAGLRARKAISELDQIIYGIIRQRRESGEDPGDLLSMLLNARDAGSSAGEFGDRMSDKQLRDEVMTLFLAGHETTAILLSWGLYLLSQNPEARGKLEAELDRVLPDRDPQVSDLPNLPYTTAVVNETLRMYPPAWVIGREAVEDVQIGGYHLPKGSLFLMSQWVVHHDARFYADPWTFLPDRWLETGAGSLEKRLPRFAYFPFGGGPRQCIGNNFALMEANLILATIARRFRLSLQPGFEPHPFPSITLRPRSGMLMELHRRI